jgi:phytoene dehydrogenase-like protein
MEKSIIIIGAGIAGLSAGCYSQMNGYRTQIFEMDNTNPGGLCTTWKRKGYKIDACIEFWMGTGLGTNFYHFWEELGALQGRTIIYQDEWSRVEGKEGKVLIFYTDMYKLEQHMKELAPEDKDVIEELIKDARAFVRIKGIPPEKTPEVMGSIDGLKMMYTMRPLMRLMKKWGKMTVQDFAQRFNNPFLRQAFPYMFNNLPYMTMFGMLSILGSIQQKQTGYPLGGSLEIARAIEQRYRNLGGEIHYKSRVAKILVENDNAVGVRLADDTEHRSDIVISAADGRTTIFDMLDGKYVNDKIQGYYDNLPTMPPLIYIGLGVARSFDEPSSAFGINFLLDEPVTIAGQEITRLPVHIYNFDPSLAPAGKTALRVKLDSDYDYWKKLREDPERYKAEKEQIADKVVTLLDQRFPGLAAQVEMRDVATPMTFERYTGNWRGSYMGWKSTTETLGMRMSKTVPGLGNFYMAGMWVDPPGGTPGAVMSGRYVTQIICKRDKKKFVTSTP